MEKKRKVAFAKINEAQIKLKSKTKKIMRRKEPIWMEESQKKNLSCTRKLLKSEKKGLNSRYAQEDFIF